MISLRKRTGTPLVEGLYVARQRSMYQIRLKDTQEVMSAVTSIDELKRCGQLLIDRYRTVENLRRQLANSEYASKVAEMEVIRRQATQEKWLESELYKDWYAFLTGAETKVVTEVKKKRKRLKII